MRLAQSLTSSHLVCSNVAALTLSLVWVHCLDLPIMALVHGHDVSTAVSNIIAAFNSLRDTVCKIRTNSTKKSHKPPMKNRAKSNGMCKDEKSTQLGFGEFGQASRRLDASLGSAPSAIHHEYARGLVTHGDRFQAGDSEALASLAATLVKLNTGLVNIISSFLNTDRKHHGKGPRNLVRNGVDLDFASLALLSEASRIESCKSLADLRTRLSCQSPLAEPLSTTKPKRKKGRPNPKHRASSPAIHTSNQMKWALIRTRPKPQPRKHSTASAGSSTSRSDTLIGSEPSSPANGTFSKPPLARTEPSRQKDKIKGGAKSPKPIQSPNNRNAGTTNTRIATVSTPNLLAQSQQTISGPPIPPKVPLNEPTTPLPMYEPFPSPSQLPPRYSQISNLPPFPRRFPSTRTATTASTRLGEIPMHRWPEQPDFDEMSRLNAEASAGRRVSDGLTEYNKLKQDPRPAQRRGLFAKMFRKTPVAQVASA